eukprot:2230062-Amphidinium_carterae.1
MILGLDTAEGKKAYQLMNAAWAADNQRSEPSRRPNSKKVADAGANETENRRLPERPSRRPPTRRYQRKQQLNCGPWQGLFRRSAAGGQPAVLDVRPEHPGPPPDEDMVAGDAAEEEEATAKR